MTGNLLGAETSPYLLQHRDNPVHWRPWGPDALAEAEELDRPILLSIGYAACHWCHVMAHESFEDEATAAVMNRLFVNIKVDREERPDIDSIYMAALHALGEQGGWPLTMFLTPAGEPVWGGTYFPKVPQFGRPAFVDVLESVARTFRESPDAIARNRDGLLQHLREPAGHAPAEPTPALLDAAADRIASIFDRDDGGLRGAPKFPQPAITGFLWRSADRTGREALRTPVLNTLRHIVQGGIYDHVAGGMARYSVDDRWLVPHFEKMLYDNAQLIERLTQAWLRTGEPLFRRRIEETVAWLFREMAVGDAFAASIDADSAGGEGAFAVWTPDGVAAVLGDERGAVVNRLYDITPGGNFEHASIPNRLGSLDWLGDTEEDALAADMAKLLAARQSRPQPMRDDKVLADWNGLTIAALTNAARALDRPDWLTRAETANRFVAESMHRDGRLGHSWRGGKLVHPGFASDHGAMLKAALALHAATGYVHHLEHAIEFAQILDRDYWDDTVSAYRLTAADAEGLITRPLPLTDEALPSANGLIAEQLAKLWQLTGDDQWRHRVDTLLHAHAGAIAANVLGTASLLSALDQRLNGVQIVIIAAAVEGAAALLQTVTAEWRDAHTLLIVADGSALPRSHPAHGKTARDGRATAQATAYVCRGETCSLPVTDPAELRSALAGPATR